MAKEQAPAFQFYPRDFLADGDQAALTLEECGAYARMLSFSWLKVGLVNDRCKIARMIGGSEEVVATVLREHFMLQERSYEQRWVNTRQEEERRKQAKHRKQKKIAGEASAEKRRQRALGVCSPSVPTDPPTESNSSSASSSAIALVQDDPPIRVDPVAEFTAAWDHHPHTPKVQEWTAERLATIRRRLKTGRNLLDVVRAFDASGFLAGTRPRGEGHESFRATVDWCLKPANLIKILEGAYADAGAGPSVSARRVAEQRPTYDAAWCHHEPRCGTRDWHAALVGREQAAEETPA